MRALGASPEVDWENAQHASKFLEDAAGDVNLAAKSVQKGALLDGIVRLVSSLRAILASVPDTRGAVPKLERIQADLLAARGED